jgi:hypothetical protein
VLTLWCFAKIFCLSPQVSVGASPQNTMDNDRKPSLIEHPSRPRTVIYPEKTSYHSVDSIEDSPLVYLDSETPDFPLSSFPVGGKG